MRKKSLHIGSFLIGLLAGVVILMCLALSQPLHTETQTSQLLRRESRQIQVTSTDSVDKTWLQVRSELSAGWQKIAENASQSFHKDFARVSAGLHGASFQPCTWFAWLDRQFVHFAATVHIHTGLGSPPVCSS
jgi:hypothetical protein